MKQFFVSTKFYGFIFLWCDIVMKEIVEVKVKVRLIKLSKKDNGRVERKQEDFVRCGEIVYLQKTKRRWQISREQLSQRRNLGRIIYMYRRTDGKSNSATWRSALTSAQYLNYNVSLILWKKSLFHIIFILVRRLCLGFKRRDNRYD